MHVMHSDYHDVIPLLAMQQRIAMGRRDIFRSRKQNTSRPPSMHVDDFMRGASARVSTTLCHSHDTHMTLM